MASNRKARHDYHIEETWEAGLVLTGRGVVSGQSLDDVDDLGLADSARGGSEPRGDSGS